MPPPSGGGDTGGGDDDVASAAAATTTAAVTGAAGSSGDDGDTAASTATTTSAFAHADLDLVAMSSSPPLQLASFLPPPATADDETTTEEETTADVDDDASSLSAEDGEATPPAEDDIGHNLHTLRRRGLDTFTLDAHPPLPPQTGAASTSYASSLPYGLNDHDEFTSTVGTCSYSGRGVTSSTPITPVSFRASTSGHGGGPHARHGNLRSLSHRLHKAAGGAGAVAAHHPHQQPQSGGGGGDAPLETPLSVRLPPPHTSGPRAAAGGGVGESGASTPGSWSSSSS
eukprot:Rhum_TRINITY_DN9485_c0_g1::Rhum_TRINITY_DN9485_c0_g1_i1::g.33697::m.33697